MKIAIITMWYNEEVLAPIFLKHYRKAVDSFYVLLDTATTDNTAKICESFGVKVIPFGFPAGMNDWLKIRQYNKYLGIIVANYIIGLDADEFIYEPRKMRNYLSAYKPDFQIVEFHQMYQHESEKPINQKDPVFKQRRHGDPSLEGWNDFYVKPCIVKAGIGVNWAPGCHSINLSPKSLREGQRIKGAHWHMADVELSIKRRLGIRKRQSRVNIDGNLTAHNHKITEKEIRSVCKQHENDPRIF